MSKRLIMTFEVSLDADSCIDEENLKELYGGEWFNFASEMFSEEGFWWSDEMKLVQTRIVEE